MKIETLLDRVVLKPYQPPKQGKILLAARHKQDDVILGTVVSIGPDVVDIKVGDRVLYDRTKSQDVYHEGARGCEVLRQEDVCAKV